jgi:hypothetical protein
VCHTDLVPVLVVHDADGVPDLEVRRREWIDLQDTALLREAEKGTDPE